MCALKIIKKRLPNNMPQNLKSRSPDRPNVDFGIDFGTLLASFVHYFFDFLIKCANHQNAFIHSSSVAWAHSKSSFFFYQISIKFSYIFWCFILGLIFWAFGATWCPKGGFWEPLGAQLGRKWRPKSRKRRPKSSCLLYTSPSPRD